MCAKPSDYLNASFKATARANAPQGHHRLHDLSPLLNADHRRGQENGGFPERNILKQKITVSNESIGLMDDQILALILSLENEKRRIEVDTVKDTITVSGREDDIKGVPSQIEEWLSTVKVTESPHKVTAHQLVLSAKYPSHWHIYKERAKTKLLKQGSNYQLVDIGDEVRRGFEDVINSKLNQRTPFIDSKLHIIKMHRIENPALWTKYRFELIPQLEQSNLENLLPVELVIQPESEILTRGFEAFDSLLIKEINECYLFHGTNDKATEKAILAQGFENRFSNGGNFGNGIYFADDIRKSNDYVDSNDGVRRMFMARVQLGHVHYSEGSRGFKRPPCLTCLRQKCKHARQFDSVVGTKTEPERPWDNFEFVVYDNRKCYPEYILTYELEI